VVSTLHVPYTTIVPIVTYSNYHFMSLINVDNTESVLEYIVQIFVKYYQCCDINKFLLSVPPASGRDIR